MSTPIPITISSIVAVAPISWESTTQIRVLVNSVTMYHLAKNWGWMMSQVSWGWMVSHVSCRWMMSHVRWGWMVIHVSWRWMVSHVANMRSWTGRFVPHSSNIPTFGSHMVRDNLPSSIG